MKTVIKTIIVVALLAVFGGIVYIYSGVYNVAATSSDTALTKWALETAREASIESRAEELTPPDKSVLADPKTLRIGFEHYDEMCLVCHGAPGMEPGEAREGLNPKPPLLAKEADDMSEKEMFWVIKNGIKMTGMPGWGPTHSDDKIWAMVAFVKSMPTMTPEDYRIMRKEAEMAGGHMDHDHDENAYMH
jgi:mono/diheme cytochrome c family protein